MMRRADEEKKQAMRIREKNERAFPHFPYLERPLRRLRRVPVRAQGLVDDGRLLLRVRAGRGDGRAGDHCVFFGAPLGLFLLPSAKLDWRGAAVGLYRAMHQTPRCTRVRWTAG